MDGPREYQQVKQVREKQILYDTSYMWNLKNDTNEFIYKTESQTQKTNLQLPKQKGQGGINLEYGINRYKINRYKLVDIK